VAHKKSPESGAKGMAAWPITASKEIGELIQRAPNDSSLGNAQSWRADLEVWLRENSITCPYAELKGHFKSILADLQRSNLVITRDPHFSGSGDPNYLNAAILAQCLNLAKLAQTLILQCSGEGQADLQEPATAVMAARDSPPASATARDDFRSRMKAAREGIGHPQPTAAALSGVSRWAHIEQGKQNPRPRTKQRIQRYMAIADTIGESTAGGIYHGDEADIERLFRNTPDANETLRHLRCQLGRPPNV
jgi:DNA-binding XRE family transcriptional regulator